MKIKIGQLIYAPSDSAYIHIDPEKNAWGVLETIEEYYDGDKYWARWGSSREEAISNHKNKKGSFAWTGKHSIKGVFNIVTTLKELMEE